jgi:hypothetical protein
MGGRSQELEIRRQNIARCSFFHGRDGLRRVRLIISGPLTKRKMGTAQRPSLPKNTQILLSTRKLLPQYAWYPMVFQDMVDYSNKIRPEIDELRRRINEERKRNSKTAPCGLHVSNLLISSAITSAWGRKPGALFQTHS